jgi:vacuolar-type H+-ATPase subunit E/Vma4
MDSYKSKFLEKEDLDKRHFREAEKFTKRIYAIENEIKNLASEMVKSKLSRERRQQIQKLNLTLHEQLAVFEKIRKSLDSL